MKNTWTWAELEVTYLPHEAVAEVSKDKEPIGKGCAEWKWFESQLMSASNELKFKWFGCQSMCASNDFGCLLIWTSDDAGVNWFEIQVIRHCNWSEIEVIWLSIDLRFKWVGRQLNLRFKWFGCQIIGGSSDLKLPKKKLSARLPSKMELWSSKTKLFCETSFKIEAVKLKNEAFLRDFLQKWNFEAQKRSFSARLPSKTMLWRSKTKLFCETSFKNGTVKLKNEAFLRDFLQKRCFEDQKQSIFARLPSKMTCRPDTWPQNYNTF